jgi:hypothetical protein
MTAPDRPRVHILREGRTLCGKDGLPAEWLDGDRWIEDSIAEQATCSACRLFAGLERITPGGPARPPSPSALAELHRRVDDLARLFDESKHTVVQILRLQAIAIGLLGLVVIWMLVR